MSLRQYHARRDFAKTREPPGKPAAPPRKPSSRASKKPIFVIQEHHASRLHWDFRLEADGVLKSWAVPKAPTMDPTVRRLAVHVEDHPLDYAKFHGDIPAGQYGAGHVEIWDHGTYQNLMALKPTPMTLAQSVEAGHVEIKLSGKKLIGDFALVRMNSHNDKYRGKDNWLLLKMREPG
jgi:bifunctional non-homologous end joining protein LigD